MAAEGRALTELELRGVLLERGDHAALQGEPFALEPLREPGRLADPLGDERPRGWRCGSRVCVEARWAWLDGPALDGRRRLYSLLDELCSGIDISRHNPFGFLRLRAEFETSGELFGCTLPELRDAVAASLGADGPPPPLRPRSALESLRDDIATRGHPDFR